MEDTKLQEILQLQQEGIKRADIADKLWNGIHKSNMRCLTKYMERRGYVLDKDKNIFIASHGVQKEPISTTKEVIKPHNENTEVIKKETKKNTKKVQKKELEEVVLDKEYIKSSMWVMSTVWEDWKAYTDKNNHFKKQYLLSQALKEYMENHK